MKGYFFRNFFDRRRVGLDARQRAGLAWAASPDGWLKAITISSLAARAAVTHASSRSADTLIEFHAVISRVRLTFERLEQRIREGRRLLVADTDDRGTRRGGNGQHEGAYERQDGGEHDAARKHAVESPLSRSGGPDDSRTCNTRPGGTDRYARESPARAPFTVASRRSDGNQHAAAAVAADHVRRVGHARDRGVRAAVGTIGAQLEAVQAGHAAVAAAAGSVALQPGLGAARGRPRAGRPTPRGPGDITPSSCGNGR